MLASNLVKLLCMCVYTHVKISQVVTGLSHEQYLNNIVVMREQQYIVGPTISSILVSTILLSNDEVTILSILASTILLSNDEATMFFMAVGNRGN